MFEVGFTEIILIFGIALLVLGPARLPKLAADLGRWAGRARAMARQLRSQLEQEVQFDPLAGNASAPPHAGPSAAHAQHAPPPATAPAPPAGDAGTTIPTTDAGAATLVPAGADPSLSPDATVPDERKPG